MDKIDAFLSSVNGVTQMRKLTFMLLKFADCANQNQVWACSVLGYLVCLLVSCVWYMGFTNTWCSYYMTVVILFMHISPVFVLLNNYSFPMGASVELHHDAIHD